MIDHGIGGNGGGGSGAQLDDSQRAADAAECGANGGRCDSE